MNASAERNILEIYDYQDECGQLLFQVVRFEPKGFAQRVPDGNGGFAWDLDGARRVPYGLPELCAAPHGSTILIAEGEKDVEHLRQRGFIATTNPGGAGKWRPEFAKHFSGKRVVILPDNDAPGLCHAEDIARNIHATAANVKILWLPGVPEHGDVADWFVAGHTKQELLEIIRQTPSWQPPSEAESETERVSSDAEPEHLTDMGNAKRLVTRYGKDLRYCHRQKQWYAWDNIRWAADHTGEVERRAKNTVASIYLEAGMAESETERKALAAWAARSE